MKSINTGRKSEEKSESIKAVFDNNVMVSALLWTGLPHKLLVMAQKGKISLSMTLDMLDELEEILGRKKFQHRIETLNASVEELMTGIELIVNIYTVVEKVKV